MNLEIIDKSTNIGYFGVPGSYSHEAMLSIFGEGYNEVNIESFEGVFKLLEEGKIKYGVVPIENSSTGGISDVMDLLNKYKVFIVKEKCMRINQCLLGIEECHLDDIQEVYSHPQASNRARFLQAHSHWKLYNYYNTAKRSICKGVCYKD